ncbi:enoyl-CoA hydratase-related protein [Paracoccus seriniphilus]|uniref:Short chain enoyl-CoA hydratase /Enoyl-CoA hydratase n=1 Tax=Paracoccus seriniphilus TaxID=184748 RepID=A0A239PSB3_9RHOB|nr:enoyl-CoA hydratase-related protein [Paracoccus seriniphilus]WCR12970.1 enoyl-CoA hydratase/isomerase family protein [Paracoccus seriniphilus]SNT72597.1 short chain enoyl-CoA hydratase /Enoyl-CoA hydratase [Paracoccus seriniphilus]
MSYQTIQFGISDGIATLILNRPEVMNALNRQMRAEITRALATLSQDVRCVVMTGSGRAFCSGQDLTDAAAATDLETTLRDEYEPMLHAVMNCSAPVIAAVNGVAAGAGANLALVADVVIAAENASFVQAFTRIGLIPDAGGTWMMPRLTGLARAAGMMLFADSIPAQQAADWGMIYQSCADDDFAEIVAARAKHLAQGPTSAYLAIREALRQSFGNDLDSQLQLEARLQGQAGRSHDFQEGVAAFLQKRKPVFTGK